MNGGHQTIGDAPFVVQYFGDGSQAVGGARSVRNEFLTGIGLFVYTAYEHGGVVFRRSRHNDIFGTGIDVTLSFFFGQEETGRLYNIFSTYGVPFQVGRILFSRHADFLTVNNQLAVFYVGLDGTVELSVHRIIFEHICQIVYGAQVIDSNDLNVVSLLSSTENKTSDAAETINTYFNHCSKF